MNKFATAFLCLVQASIGVCTMGVRAKTVANPEPDWRIVRVQMAPWSSATAAHANAPGWVGQPVLFRHDSVDGPGLLHCAHALLESTSYPAEALFQGNLPAPARVTAQAMGIREFPVEGFSLRCDTGLFEFHLVAPETLLLGLDNLVLTLSRTAGTLASPDSPEGRTQRFLEAHFGGDMGFSRTRTNAHRTWFSTRLNGAISTYFAKPMPKDEVPAIDGDPFTDSQEYPQRFVVGKARIANDTAEVPVRFSNATNSYVVVYLLRMEKDTWRLDDLHFASAKNLLVMLQ